MDFGNVSRRISDYAHSAMSIRALMDKNKRVHQLVYLKSGVISRTSSCGVHAVGA